MSRLDLAQLLTASGAAMAASNGRLRSTGAAAMLREFRLKLDFTASVPVAEGDADLCFDRVLRPGPQMLALLKEQRSNVTLEATYIAAPALQPGIQRGTLPGTTESELTGP